MKLFTYGILKFPEEIMRDGGSNIVENCTVKGHQMFIFPHGGYPVTKVTGNEADQISGTLFEIDPLVVRDYYDYVEGYDPKRIKELNMYNRELVTVHLPDGTSEVAQMYVANPVYFVEYFVPLYHIRSGNYSEDFIR